MLRTAQLRKFRVMDRGRWRRALGVRPPARVIAVSGAPGAGKTVVATNLAAAIAEFGAHVVVVDLSAGPGSATELIGSEQTGPSIADVLAGRLTSLDGALTATRIRNLFLISAGETTPTLDARARRTIVDHIRAIDSDVVVVDVGARDPDHAVDLISAGDLRLLVTGGEDGSLVEAYHLLAALARRADHAAHVMRRLTESAAAETRPGDGAMGSAGDVSGAWEAPPQRRRRATAQANPGFLLGNRAVVAEDTERFHGFSRLVRHHLGLAWPVLGCLWQSERIPASIARRRPLATSSGVDDNVRSFRQMAEALMVADVARPNAPIWIPEEDPPARDAGAVPETPVVKELQRFVRKHPRYDVDWVAHLVSGRHMLPVRILDVSIAGAALEVTPKLPAEDRWTLVLEQLPGQPAIPVQVKNVRPELRRAGVTFLATGELPARIVAAAMRRRGTADTTARASGEDPRP